MSSRGAPVEENPSDEDDLFKDLQVWFRLTGGTDSDLPEKTDSDLPEKTDSDLPEKTNLGLPHADSFSKYRNAKALDEQRRKGERLEDFTHMVLRNQFPPSLVKIARNLTHLKIENLKDVSQLNSVKELKSLKVLDLSFNDLSKGLPSGLFDLSKLESLKVAQCKLTDLPSGLASLTNLLLLDISGNEFTNSTLDVIGNLASLKELKLTRCKLASIPDSFKQLCSLEKFHLTGNNFPYQHLEVVAQITSVKELHLGECQLSRLPQRLKALHQLEVLDLSGNKFSNRLPPVVGHLTSLRQLILSGCGIAHLPKKLVFGNNNADSKLLRWSMLKQLETLDLSDNDFSKGVPKVITSLDSLRRLSLRRCNLVIVKSNFKMPSLQSLDLSSNKFKELPPDLYHESPLESINLSDNSTLTKLDQAVLKSKTLKKLQCVKSYRIRHPPYAVCKQGFKAIKQYFTDLQTSVLVVWSSTPVAVIGASLSGKTSLIRSLQARLRSLTFRDETSAEDETTAVFKLEEICFSKAAVRLIDYGGNDVYHLAYTLANKEFHLPIIVVNIQRFHELEQSKGPKEAVQRCLFDWMAHLYAASPNLDSPILALTHVDQVSPVIFPQCKEKLLDTAEAVKQKLLSEGKSSQVSQTQQTSNCFLDSTQPLIDRRKVFHFGTDENDIEDLRNLLEAHCEKSTSRIPDQWSNVEKFLNEDSRDYIEFAEVKKEFRSLESLPVILRYLHDSGLILWFEDRPLLSHLIFHKIPAITSMFEVLFSHSAEQKWMERLENFQEFNYRGKTITQAKYEELVEDLSTSGLLARALLENLLTKESKFPAVVAVDLLRSFNIVHGPLKHQLVDYYAIPYFAKEVMSDAWKTDRDLQFRAVVRSVGLTPPKCASQLVTVAVLNACASTHSFIRMKKNGATIRQWDCVMYLVHDDVSGEISVQVSSSVNSIGNSWKKLILALETVESCLLDTWKACQLEIKIFCIHCLFIRAEDPSLEVDPNWLFFGGRISAKHVEAIQGGLLVPCQNCQDKKDVLSPSVPGPLQLPCFELSEAETGKIRDYLKELEGSLHRSEADDTGSTSDSEVSDYVDEDRFANIQGQLKIMPVMQKRGRRLFHHASKVYSVDHTVKERVLIIDNKSLESATLRLGCEKDCACLRKVFEGLHFQIEEYKNLNAQDVRTAVENETQRTEHYNNNLFVLVFMGHAQSVDEVLGCDGQPVRIVDLLNLLSSCNFRAMAGKPKVVIIQTCAADTKSSLAIASTSGEGPSTSDAAHSLKPYDAFQSFRARRKMGQPPQPISAPTLDERDFCLLLDCYKPPMKPKDSSLMARVLVATFSNYAYTRDIESLFTIMQRRMRTIIARKKGKAWAVTPIVKSTLTKKLYFASRNAEPTGVATTSHSSVDSDSDISDVEKYCTEPIEARLDMKVKPVRQYKIMKLFHNPDKVYKMSDPCRGRVLIINNNSFSDGSRIAGSELDYDNICRLFRDLRFHIARTPGKLTNLRAEEMYAAIKEETGREEHKGYGMFVLVVMSHGRTGDVILDRDCQPVHQVALLDLLSAFNFPAMKGKPKLLIMNASSGDRVDYGDAMEQTPYTTKISHLPGTLATLGTSAPSIATPVTSAPPIATPGTSAPPIATPGTSAPPIATPGTSAPHISGGLPLHHVERPRPTVLNMDDFLVLKASIESYEASRTEVYGSLFIRTLASTFYKHANHRDVETLFKIVQHRMRKISLQGVNYLGGNVPSSMCTFTDYRKLYLFPGFPATHRKE